MEKPVIATLAQRMGPGRFQEATLHEDEIHLHFRSTTTDSRRTVALELIDPNETTARAFPRWSRPIFRLASILALVTALWAIRLGAALWPASVPTTAWIAAISAGTAALALILHFSLATDTIYFYHGFTGEFLFALHQHHPDRTIVKAFVDKVTELARKRYEQLKSDAERPSAAKELQFLHALREKKILTDEEFACKKAELLEEVLRE